MEILVIGSGGEEKISHSQLKEMAGAHNKDVSIKFRIATIRFT